MQSSMNTIHRYLTCTTYPVILSTDWSKEKTKAESLKKDGNAQNARVKQVDDLWHSMLQKMTKPL